MKNLGYWRAISSGVDPSQIKRETSSATSTATGGDALVCGVSQSIESTMKQNRSLSARSERNIMPSISLNDLFSTSFNSQSVRSSVGVQRLYRRLGFCILAMNLTLCGHLVSGGEPRRIATPS